MHGKKSQRNRRNNKRKQKNNAGKTNEKSEKMNPKPLTSNQELFLKSGRRKFFSKKIPRTKNLFLF